MNRKSYWDSIYANKTGSTLSWYQQHPRRSLDLINRTALPRNARIIDVGGGDSRLVDDLLREGYILEAKLPRGAFDIWHDRAMFHFLPTAEQRDAYISAVERAVRPGGHVIVATFAEDGPTRCSGLPVHRYSAAELHGTFGAAFQLVGSERETHRTPAGVEQRFTYCWCRYEPVGVEAVGAGSR